MNKTEFNERASVKVESGAIYAEIEEAYMADDNIDKDTFVAEVFNAITDAGGKAERREKFAAFVAMVERVVAGLERKIESKDNALLIEKKDREFYQKAEASARENSMARGEEVKRQRQRADELGEELNDAYRERDEARLQAAIYKEAFQEGSDMLEADVVCRPDDTLEAVTVTICSKARPKDKVEKRALLKVVATTQGKVTTTVEDTWWLAYEGLTDKVNIDKVAKVAAAAAEEYD